MDFKLIGCILLIVGTSIGAGMLALPIATASVGFVGSVVLLLGVWVVMTAGALLILEVNLWLPQNSNLISMAKVTIGPLGQMIAWLSYLLLLYSLLCAYIAGGSDLFHHLLSVAGIKIPAGVTATIFTILFGAIVYLGIRTVDYVNRGLMVVKFGAYLLLVVLLLPLINSTKLMLGDAYHITSVTAITVTITSFGYAAIVPSLRIYFAGDIRKLKTAIFVGSFIPLICYILWDMVIMGVIPLNGHHGLIAILQSKNSTSELVNVLNATAPYSSISFFVKLFTSICVLTSFLGVALCLTDFLLDGLQLEKQGMNNIFIHFITLFPPLMIILFFPGVFIKALQYAGIYCIVLLVLLPAWMAWNGRYHRHLAKAGYRVWGGRSLLILLMFFSVIMLLRSVLEVF
ncbi:MAG TPA: aromatic amino acid transport family protein [Gammaproteobacteria bacterium]|nr:aromatic amino acid transport family protein [Gammaproteobacteria bacterium]